MTDKLKPIYDPLKFINTIELLTIAFIGSFISLKLLNVLYDHVYDPIIDIFLEDNNANNYVIKLKDYYIHPGTIFKELLKWFIIILLLMLFYNFFVYQRN